MKKKEKALPPSFWLRYRKGILVGFLVGSVGAILLFITSYAGVLPGVIMYISVPLFFILPSINILLAFLIQAILYAGFGALIQYLYQTYFKKK